MKDFDKIEKLLYGINYAVSFHLYGLGDCDSALEQILQEQISKDCKVSGVVASSPEQARHEIMDMVLYEGSTSAGPIDLKSKKNEISSLMQDVFSHIALDDADMVTEFGLAEGHPSYPVFWDFAFDVHSKGKRWILIGSGSD
ncbi:hypothetical protein [Rheinheimera sp. NSM]|uniref:hypothetical protein n=1 Tax=Rheinheimera sp. NSM TaxID=3457884 RepID=UPI004036CC5E